MGESTFATSEVGTVWAERRDLSGREQFDSMHLKIERAARWRMRRWPGLSTKHRLQDEDGNEWDIIDIDPNEFRGEMLVLAELRS
jgi:head-tail adaptor